MSGELLRAHVDAFNAGDVPALLDGLAPNATWTTGTDTFRGRDELRRLFEGAKALGPRLEIHTLAVDGEVAAAELRETLANGPAAHIAGFYRFRDGLIASARIYREGSAEPLQLAYEDGFAAARRGEEAAPGCTTTAEGRSWLRGYVDGAAAR